MRLRLLSLALVGAVAWGCSSDESAGSGTPVDADGGGGGDDGGGGGGNDGGVPSDGGDPDALAPDPNPVLLLTADGIGGLQLFGGNAYFNASDASGSEKWRTDLTKAGTLRLHDSCPGACAGEPLPIVATSNGKLVFISKTGASATAIYTTDGTAAGTTLLAAGGGAPHVAAGTKVVYRAGSASTGVTDGTAAGTGALKSVSPYFFNTENDSMTLGDRALFNTLENPGGGGSYTREVWGTDGTAAGTVALFGAQFVEYEGRAGDVGWVQTNYFAPMQFVGTAQIVATDGTVAGTKFLATSFLSGSISWETVVGNTLYFTAKGTQVGDPTALYRADANAITKVFDGSVSGFVDFGGVAHFAAGTKIRKTDGTGPGTVDYFDATPKYPSQLTAVGNALYYASGAELWKVEGAPPAATLVATFSGDCPTCTPSASSYMVLRAYGTRLFVERAFSEADNTPRPSALWLTDGTAAGTKLLKASGVASYVPTPTGVLWTNGKELWHERP